MKKIILSLIAGLIVTTPMFSQEEVKVCKNWQDDKEYCQMKYDKCVKEIDDSFDAQSKIKQNGWWTAIKNWFYRMVDWLDTETAEIRCKKAVCAQSTATCPLWEAQQEVIEDELENLK